MKHEHNELPTQDIEPLMSFLNKLIKIAIRILAVLMVLVIFWGVADVIYVLVQRITTPPIMLLETRDILKIFAAFLAVLIALEIYQNIILYIRTDIVPIKLVIATALMAIARKVIILDFKEVAPMYVFATATVVLSLGITYYLVGIHHKEPIIDEEKIIK